MASRSRWGKKKGKGKKHFIDDSHLDIMKGIRKKHAPKTQVHKSKKEKRNWRDEV